MLNLDLPGWIPLWAVDATWAAIVAAAAVALAFALHFVLFLILARVTKLSDTTSDEVVVERLRQPIRWSLVAVALSIAGEANPVLGHIWQSVARFVVPALMGWVAFSLVKAFSLAMAARADLSADDYALRSRRTRVAILSRTAGFVIVFVTVSLMLLGIPGVRNIGVTLMASAGLAGLAVGAAAQPALKSLIAGIQMALTEPVRIGDYVVIEGEGGRVEDIKMTFVVIRTSDDRRLIVPTSKFLESSFQNWTRVAGGLTGSIVLPIKSGQPIAPIREAFEKILAERDEWDKRTGKLQVYEIKVDQVELHLVVSARGPTPLAKLRSDMRELMLEWLREHMPGVLLAKAESDPPPANTE
ncbi:MAG: mechanosensitive ion channel family protein [Candidatus Andeanibacterium colombiense]|uniref:Mechanosensitive ion channel family protein n=1 Tax=Candidatus Andeanibacterium colombiense TaxID=3121345 RepID=A0AAJ5X6Z5_9SPHN|nr:MAG: mechanosensitive ion channel family protein [Sphingomonadaceae bacterium]